MKRLLKQLRKNPLVNLALRTLARGMSGPSRALSEAPARLCPVSGVFSVDYCGQRFRYCAEGDDVVADLLFYGLKPEETEVRLWIELVRRSRVALDVGANTGLYAVVAARANPAACVFAFEPHPGNCRRLARNLELNAAANVTVAPQALGKAPGRVALTVPADGSISMVSSLNEGFASGFYQGAEKRIEVECITLDAFVREQALRSVDVIKLDVEYFEGEVLEGARETLAAHSPVLLCEVFVYDFLVERIPHLAGRVDPLHWQRIEQLMQEAGYRFYTIGETGLLRVETLYSAPEHSGFLFSKKASAGRFLPYSRMEALIAELL